ncbi:hypothetical protein CPLU01_15001 [Colletotrichum plurivorum]|uniref:Uncharacterized protein n=1 Tax=Colletotrichum plurivorum TaxID=2175906 RepID=A0A8H6JF75_9PEZI|nr:hypothetical protein CPLU01_15001 [Colletotrichum plurivorum]
MSTPASCDTFPAGGLLLEEPFLGRADISMQMPQETHVFCRSSEVDLGFDLCFLTGREWLGVSRARYVISRDAFVAINILDACWDPLRHALVILAKPRRDFVLSKG